MITLDRGIKIQGLDLWLDATRSRPLSFVSHVHQDPVARHQQAIRFPLTANLLQKRDSGIKKITALIFYELLQFNGTEVELFAGKFEELAFRQPILKTTGSYIFG